MAENPNDVPEQFRGPAKYKMTFKDKNGREESQYVAMSPDPNDPEKVKQRLLETRGDLYNRGVTADTLTVERAGTQTKRDQEIIADALSGVPKPVRPK